MLNSKFVKAGVPQFVVEFRSYTNCSTGALITVLDMSDPDYPDCILLKCDEAREVAFQALNEWGLEELHTPAPQSMFYHAVLLEIENREFIESLQG